MQTNEVTPQQRQRLVAMGFEVEDMSAANGPGWWDGHFRWMRYDSKGDVSYFGSAGLTEEEAWIAALAVVTELVATP
jgi:hypothetical protein